MPDPFISKNDLKKKSISHSNKSSLGNNKRRGNLLRMSTYLTYLSVFIQWIRLGWSDTANNQQRAWYSLDVANTAASDDHYLMIDITNELAIFENTEEPICSLFTEVINNSVAKMLKQKLIFKLDYHPKAWDIALKLKKIMRKFRVQKPNLAIWFEDQWKEKMRFQIKWRNLKNS